jgi:hypothetical protein
MNDRPFPNFDDETNARISAIMAAASDNNRDDPGRAVAKIVMTLARAVALISQTKEEASTRVETISKLILELALSPDTWPESRRLRAETGAPGNLQ